MISMKKIGPVTGGVIVCVLGLWSLKTTNLFSNSKTASTIPSNEPLKKSKVVVANRETASLQPTDDVSTPAASVAEALPASAPTAANDLPKVKILSNEQLENLKSFQKIKAKVFASDEEKSLRKKLLSDSSLLKNLKSLIIDAPAAEMGSDDYTQKTVALDLLIEASVANSAEATAALIEIVQDKKIENDNLPLAERQAMAELKADLLYNWTAKVPSQASHVNEAIPGPVTAQIWKNAQQAQEQNRIESATTK